MIPSTNVDYMWNVVVDPRIGIAPYAFGGSFDPNNVTVGTDCSGAASAELGALIYGQNMPWTRQFWTGTFADAVPGQTGPFGGVAETAPLVCIASPAEAPSDAAMIIAVLQDPDPDEAHMICQVGGINIEMGGPTDSYVMGSRATDIHNPEFNQWFYLPGPVVTTTNGIDYSGGRPGGAAIASAGFGFACRYVFDGSPNLPEKLLTASEADDLLAHNVQPVSNWESTADSALGGYAQGVSDAQAANANHLAAGGPSDRPIYFSVDFDEAQSQDPAVDAYFQGVNSVIGLPRTGAYGAYWIISRLFDAGLITYGWQTEAWSSDPARLGPDGPDGDYLDPRVNILQRNAAGFVNISGVQCDVDIAYTDDYGQWGYTGGIELTPDQAAQLAQVWGALFNPITSQSPFRSPGEGAIWEQHQIPINDDGFVHPMYVEWAAQKGDAGALAVLQAVAAMSPVAYPDRASDIKLAQSILAEIAPAAVPAIVTPADNPATDVGNITVSQLLQWGKDLMTIVGAIATWATSAHNVLGQFLPGATGTAVPLTLAALTTGLGAHTVRQKRVAQKALANQ